MAPTQPSIRVIVRLPWNRPEEPIPDPPPVEWNSEKEAILWEVIARSRAVEGAGTDWKGLANHLQVPLPYLLYRAQVRYEEDLRGLQDIKGALSPISPPAGQGVPSNTPPAKPSSTSGEYFPSTPIKTQFPRIDSLRLGGGPLSASGSRPPIRVRLNSLGQRTLSSPQKVTSSSILTLQGPKRPHTQLRPLTPTSSHASPSSRASSSDESDEDEDARKEAEEEKRAEEQEALERKLRDLERRMTKEALGLVASPPKPAPYRVQEKGKGRETEPVPVRTRPLSSSSASSSLHQRLDMSRIQITGTQTPSHHSLSSASSPQGSIPSIPSPPPETRSPRLAPTKPFSPGKTTSPPVINHGPAWGTMRTASRNRIGGNGRSERGSEIGSGASSFSDLSDADLSESIESALMSNISNMSNMSNYRPAPRLPSFARNSLTPRRGSTR